MQGEVGVNVIISALNELVLDMLSFLPKLIVALLIWYIGKYLIHVAEQVVRKFDIKATNRDDAAINSLARIVQVVGKAILVLVVLDYLGIGRTIVGSIANGLTFAVAIALGLSFGKALEADAQELVAAAKKFLHK